MVQPSPRPGACVPHVARRRSERSEAAPDLLAEEGATMVEETAQAVAERPGWIHGIHGNDDKHRCKVVVFSSRC